MDYGCQHYKRKCKILSPCCNTFYSCRFCHDEAQYDEEPNYLLKHKIDRYSINTIQCSNCSTSQNIKQYCENCNTCFGQYYCDICHLFDDVDKQQFHCSKCNICRVGGSDNYTHCDMCNLCVKNCTEHKCISVTDTCCPICMDLLFESTLAITQMKCGHRIHITCFNELIKTSYKCPLCCESLGKMDYINTCIDNEILNSPMPPEYNYNVKILCNDCHMETETKFHIFGMKCGNCNCYNTKRV